MKLPWSNKKENKIEELREEIEKLREEKNRFKKRFQAADEKRSNLAREKQEAQEKINKLQDKLSSAKNREKSEKTEESINKFEKLDFKTVYDFIDKIQDINSSNDDLITIYSHENLENLEDFKGLQNSLNKETWNEIKGEDNFVSFLDTYLLNFMIKTRPFFDSKWRRSNSFETKELSDFIALNKHWVLVTAGETKIYEEANGDYKLVEKISSRVEHEHSQGGFSQSRFQRKREKQIKEHLETVKSEIKNLEEVYLLGDKALCKDLDGKYLGGFDPNLNPPNTFYNFRAKSF